MKRFHTFLIVSCASCALTLTTAAQQGGGQGGSQGGGSGQSGQGAGQGQKPGSTGGQTGNGQGSGNQGAMGQRPGASSTGMRAMQLQRGDRLIGSNIQDAKGGRIGAIQDLVLRPNGEIAYAVVAGTGANASKLYPIPWHTLQMQSANASSGSEAPAHAGMNDALVTNFEATRLASAPSFDSTAWPKDNELGVFSQSDSFFGMPKSSTGSTSPAGGADGAGRPVDASASRSSLLRASKLQGQELHDASGQSLGSFGQLVFDPQLGRLNYVTLSLPNTAGSGQPGGANTAGNMVALPWPAVQYGRMDGSDRFQSTLTTDRLRAAPQFRTGDDSWKQMSDPAWVNQLYGYYSVKPYWNTTGTAPAGTGSPTNPGGG